MTPWATAPEEWATWTQEEAAATPSDVLDAFDAEVARRLEATGFAANLEQTSVTNVGELHPSDSDSTLIRPSPSLDDIADEPDEFGDAAVTMVHTALDDAPDVLEVGLEAPEAELHVELDASAPQVAAAVMPEPEPDPQSEPEPEPEVGDDSVDGLVLPSLTMPPTALEPPAAMQPPPLEPAEGGTVVTPAPVGPPPGYASGHTVIAPAPTEPEVPVGKTLVPTEAPPALTDAHAEVRRLDPAAPGGTEITPVTPIEPPARTGDTLPPISTHEPVPTADAKTSEVAAASSGVFRSIDIHDDEEPEPVVARQKVVVGVPSETESVDTSEIEADELDEETVVAEEEEIIEAPSRPDSPPPPRKDTPKPPPAPRSRTAEIAPPEAPVELRPEPRAPSPTGPHAAVTPRAPGWPDEVFAEHFVAMTRPHHAKLAKAEVEFFVQSTGIQPGARVLDVGCGDGTHALVLGQRGFSVTGLDASAAQLARAERGKEALGAPASFVQGDMRDLSVEGPFDAILCMGTSFGYYDDEENRAVLRAMAGLLVPGGRLLLHVFNRDHIIGRLPTRSWWQGHGCLVLDEAQMNFFTNRLSVHRTIVFEDGRQFEHRLQIRGYNAHELGRMCVDAGLRIVEISGDRLTRGRFYGASSADIWLVLELKP